jgi:hypothetical protein
MYFGPVAYRLTYVEGPGPVGYQCKFFSFQQPGHRIPAMNIDFQARMPWVRKGTTPYRQIELRSPVCRRLNPKAHNLRANIPTKLLFKQNSQALSNAFSDRAISWSARSCADFFAGCCEQLVLGLFQRIAWRDIASRIFTVIVVVGDRITRLASHDWLTTDRACAVKSAHRAPRARPTRGSARACAPASARTEALRWSRHAFRHSPG